MTWRLRWLGSLVLLLGSSALNVRAATQAPSQDPFQLGLIALRENRLDAALEAFTAAEQDRPDDARIHNFRGIVLMSLGRRDEAAGEYHRAIGLDNRLEDAYRNLAFLEWTGHQFDSARMHLERAVRINSDDLFARFYLGRLEIEDRHYEKGLAVFKSLADGNGRSSVWAQFDLSLAHIYAGEYQNAASLAQALCQRTQVSSAELASAYSIIGVASARLRRDGPAVDAFRKAANLAPGHEEHWLNLTRELMEANRLADAIAGVQDGLKANPTSYALHLRLGAAYFSSGHYADAENSFRDLVTAGDPLPTSYIGLAQVLLRTGRATEAVTELAAAEQKLGPQFLIIYFKGLALDRSGKRAESLAAFKQAVQLNPNSAEAYLGVGKVSLGLGHISEAVEGLQRVLQLDPGNRQARRLLGQAYARLGDTEKAVEFANSRTDEEPERATSLTGDFLLPDWQQPMAP